MEEFIENLINNIIGSPLPLWLQLFLIMAALTIICLPVILLIIFVLDKLFVEHSDLLGDKNERIAHFAKIGYASAVKRLLKRGAVPNATQLDEMQAAFEALADAYDARDANLPLSAAERGRNAQLIEAAEKNNTRALWKLARQGAPTTPTAPTGTARRVLAPGEQTALMLAAGKPHHTLTFLQKYLLGSRLVHPENAHTAAVQHLLEAGADVDAVTDRGETALMKAAYEGHTAAVRLLLKYGANPNAADNESQTALMDASIHGHTATVQCLLEHGADVNASNSSGETALILAATFGHAATVQCLLAHGADANIADKNGKTALLWAARDARDPLSEDSWWWHLEWILPRFRPSPPGHADAVRHLLEYGANADAADDEGWTALMRTAYYGKTAVVQCLLEHGADANVSTAGGTTALMGAAQQGHAAIVQLLLDAGADAHATDAQGGTALRFAKLGRNRKSKPGHDETIRLLTAATAYPSARNNGL